MKSIYILFVLLLMFSIGCKETAGQSSLSAERQSLTAKVQLPLYQDLNGNEVSLEDFKGKRIVLNFWATWCRPCIEEMPSMLNAQELLKDDGYVFLLASDQSMDKIKAFKEKKKFDFTFIKYNGSWAEQGVNALPATFIYNTKGEQVERIDGITIWDSPEIIQKLKDIK